MLFMYAPVNLCIWVILVAMETTVKGYWPSIIIMIGVHPNLVTTFKPFLYLNSSEKSLVKSHFRLKYGVKY